MNTCKRLERAYFSAPLSTGQFDEQRELSLQTHKSSQMSGED